MLKSMQGKEDFTATPPLSYLLLLAKGSQVIFDLAIASTSPQRIPGGGVLGGVSSNCLRDRFKTTEDIKLSS